MGFLFAGKKKTAGDDAGGDSDRSPAQRKSRRIVTPGGASGAAPAAKPASGPTPAAKPQGAPSKPMPAAATKPGAPAPASGPQRPVVKPNLVQPKTAKPEPQVTTPALMLGNAPAPTGRQDKKPSGPAAAAARPKSREPIVASKPLDFGGDLASGARGGPCRTGDPALIEFLVSKAKLLDADQGANVRNKANEEQLAIDVAAVQLGFISEEQLVNALTQECWVPHLKVDKYEIRKKALDTISRDDAMHFGVFPVDKLGSLLTLAMVNPLDSETIRALESKTGLDIKKVVATRAEIIQGIEKYYSGQVVAKDTSLAFTQDVEPKSVTQMMSKVGGEAAPTAASSRPLAIQAAVHHEPNIVPDIEDIDDLLSSDEIIAPAIIEPVAIKPAEEPAKATDSARLAIKPEAEPTSFAPELELDDIVIKPATQMVRPSSAPAKSAPVPVPSAKDDVLDLDIDITAPEPATKQPPAAKPTAPVAAKPAPGLQPTLKQSGPQPVSAPKTSSSQPATAAQSGTQSALSPKAASPAPKPATAAPAPSAPATKPEIRPTTNRFGSPSTQKPETRRITGRVENPNQVNLIPVMEEEFQHAITHGKAHVFEKWVGLQTRNRIINGVPVEEEMNALLSGLYASPKKI